MSTEAINIVVNLSLEGTILSFNVEKSEICDELTKIESESDFGDSCPICTCKISVFSRQTLPQIKAEVLSESESAADIFDVKVEKVHSDEDVKPVVELFIEQPTVSNPKLLPKPEKLRIGQGIGRLGRKTVSPLRCLHCNLIFRNEYLLFRHQQRFEIVGSLSEPVPSAVKCKDHCGRYFDNEEEQQKHLKEGRPKKVSHRCDKCPEVFKDARAYRYHLFLHGPVKCHKCILKLEDRESYKQHMKTHVSSRAYKCKFCNRTLGTEAILEVHIRWFHENNHSCSFCGKTFAVWKILLEHENQHKNIAPYQCHQCGAAFSRKNTFLSHVEGHQGNVYICNFCGKGYKHKKYLSYHIPLHVNREKFECDICGKLLLTKASLRSHLNLHRGVTEFKCRFCPKIAGTQQHLQRHEMIHTDERPYICQTCGKNFRFPYQLKHHDRLHTGCTEVKSYECPVEECKKRFIYRRSFQGHLLSHGKQVELKEELNS